MQWSFVVMLVESLVMVHKYYALLCVTFFGSMLDEDDGLMTLDRFDVLLLKVIDEVLVETLGRINAQIIYEYLEKKGCAKHEICQGLEMFSMELGMLLGCGRGQMLGSAPILEETILKVLCLKTGNKYDPNKRARFADYVRELKGIYNKKPQRIVASTEVEVITP